MVIEIVQPQYISRKDMLTVMGEYDTVIILAMFIGLHIIYHLVLQKTIWCTYDIKKIHVFYKV